MALDKITPESSNLVENLSFDNSAYHAINAVAKRLLAEKYQYLVDALIPILLDESDSRSYESLAKDLIPNECDINVKVAIKIIHLAIQAATNIHNSNINDDQPIIDLDIRTSRVKRAANLIRQSGRTMVEAMGRIPFSEDEICYIVNLMTNVYFQWESGSHLGMPNWNKISIEVNRLFGTNRSAKSIADQIKTMRYQNDSRLELAYQELDELLNEDTFYIEFFLQSVIIEKELYERFANDIAFILNDLTDLRSYWEIVRDLMPEEFKFGIAAANQIISIIIDYIRFDESISFNEELFEQRKIAINVNRKRVISLADKMLENQGAVRFCRNEFARFMELRRIHIRTDGPQKGRTDYVTIAKILNNEFHEGIESRTADKLSAIVRTYRQNYKKKPYIYPSMDDYQIPIDVIVQAYFPIELHEQ